MSGSVFASASNAAPASGAEILQDLRSFNTTGSLLHIAAHPDDENTALITYFARGRGFRTAYLSLTRGDGGQNELGPEFDEKLGLARTQELLAARKLDGGRQFFTRAIDFGYSKTAEETLRFWDREQVLGDVVRIIRQFQPDVVVTRFSPTSSGSTHGHHTASGMLGVEAFKLAGDPQAYPEQLTQGLAVWQGKRVVLNGFGGRGGGSAPGSTVTLDIGGNDPVTGESFGALAARSRAMHITQGFANYAQRARASGPNEQTFVHLGGEPAEKNLFDGIDTTWARVPDGAEIGRLTEQAIADFNVGDPAASVPALLEIRKRLRGLGARASTVDHSPVQRGQPGLPRFPPPPSFQPMLNDKLDQLDRIITNALGIEVSALWEQAEYVPGERVKLNVGLSIASDVVPVTWVHVQIPDLLNDGVVPRTLKPGQTILEVFEATLGSKVDFTHPYWLKEDPAGGLATVSDPRLIGRPEAPRFPIGIFLKVGDELLEVIDQPVHVTRTASGERRQPLSVIPPVSLRFVSDVSLFAPGATRPVTIEIAAARANSAGAVQLAVPDGWKVSPANHAFKLDGRGEKAQFTFDVAAPPQPESGRVSAIAEIDGKRYSNQRIEINYPHLPVMLLQPPARARLVSLDIATRGKRVGYLPGAGDAAVEALELLGYNVTTLSGADLLPEKLRGLDAVVIGVRAFNERKDLSENLPALWSYVENGGTVIAQYNRPTRLQAERLGPYPLSIDGPTPRLRVTDETAPVTFLAPDHPALNTPNKITAADFADWVQERGAYFPSTWDEVRYTPILAMSDPGEPPLEGSLLVTQHGKGHYVYTGLAFFRQLPAGVPGAYRLFANLVSLGK